VWLPGAWNRSARWSDFLASLGHMVRRKRSSSAYHKSKVATKVSVRTQYKCRGSSEGGKGEMCHKPGTSQPESKTLVPLWGEESIPGTES
jgi:hypothetical protein